MKQRCWICALYAMMLACTLFFHPVAMAQNGTTFVQEVTLSPGNWLKHHYVRMSPEYKKAHPYAKFMENEACFLKDRKCTEADWSRVPKSQKIYIPAPSLLVRAEVGAAPPAVVLVKSADNPEFLVAEVTSTPPATAKETVLTSQVSVLTKEVGESQSRHEADKSMFGTATTAFVVVVVAGTILMLFLWNRLSATTSELKRLQLMERDAMRRVPTLTDVVHPETEHLLLVFHGAIGEIGYACDSPLEKRIYELNQRTVGYTEEFKEKFLGKTFLAECTPNREVTAIVLPPSEIVPITGGARDTNLIEQ